MGDKTKARAALRRASISAQGMAKSRRSEDHNDTKSKVSLSVAAETQPASCLRREG
jgi:hypothetical protein